MPVLKVSVSLLSDKLRKEGDVLLHSGAFMQESVKIHKNRTALSHKVQQELSGSEPWHNYSDSG